MYDLNESYVFNWVFIKVMINIKQQNVVNNNFLEIKWLEVIYRNTIFTFVLRPTQKYYII